MDRSIRGALLPHLFTLTENLSFRPASGGIFSVALSVKPALSEPPRPLAGMLPYGDRTFLASKGSRLPPKRDCPSARHFIVTGNRRNGGSNARGKGSVGGVSFLPSSPCT